MSKRARGRQELVAKEFDSVDLGDPRRSRRAKVVAERLAASPDASLPVAMVDRAMLEGLYRHLSNAEVSFEALIEPHLRKCAGRVVEAGTVYAIHDTTECSFGGASRREGLGTLNTKNQGFLAHVTLAVSADGSRMPLGLLGVERLVRKGLKHSSKKSDRELLSDLNRESLRWMRGVIAAERQAGSPGQLIHVADREGDMYGLLAQLAVAGQRFIVRSAQPRAVLQEPKSTRSLHDVLRETPTSFTAEAQLSPRHNRGTPSRHPAREGRTATLSFASATVRLRRPKVHEPGLPPELTINAVHVFELSPPTGQPPVEWILLTSEPIATRVDIERVVEGYRTRWIVEEYFKAVKTGCAYESRQLESFGALENLLAYTLVVAYALLVMRALARTEQRWPAEAVLSDTEIAVLQQLDKPKLPKGASLREALLAIAALGGHLKNNGDPGWQVLSRGWQRLRDYEAGFKLAKALADL